MRRGSAALLLLLCACAAPELKPGEEMATFSLPAWPAKLPDIPKPAAPAVNASTLPFRAAPPAGYQAATGRLSEPIEAFFVKELPDAEAALLVERYSISTAAFASGLGTHSPPVARRFGKNEVELYEGIEFKYLGRRISDTDAYADRLGTEYPPPGLGLGDARRFPKGGDAYRLYRCRRKYAWDILAAYRRQSRTESDLSEFKSKLEPNDRGVLSACFGQAVLSAVLSGAEIPLIAKPSMSALRAMAGEESAFGSSRRVEREAVALRSFAGGFYALRLRAPSDYFARELQAFYDFVAGFDCDTPL